MQTQLSLPTLNEVMAQDLEQLLLTYAVIRSDYRADKCNLTQYHERIAVAVREAFNKHEERITAVKPKAVISADPNTEIPFPYGIETLRYVGPASEEYADITDD
jgi:chromosome segregation and condensation protein ScpB